MRIKGGLFQAKAMHKRLYPRVNQFVYSLFYICVEISQIKKLDSWFFSLNKFNFFSFYNCDHGLRSLKSPEDWVKKTLLANKIKSENLKIFLLTHPRVLGYVFNPVSFWFCVNNKNELIAVLAEVNNTFKENHNYLIFEKDGSKLDKNKFYETKKEFHVSPFMKREGGYKFRFDFQNDKIFVAIDFFDKDDRKMLITTLSGQRKDLTNLSLIKNFILIPFLTLKVIFLIHYQALKLVLKRIKYIKKPTQFKHKLTTNND